MIREAIPTPAARDGNGILADWPTFVEPLEALVADPRRDRDGRGSRGVLGPCTRPEGEGIRSVGSRNRATSSGRRTADEPADFAALLGARPGTWQPSPTSSAAHPEQAEEFSSGSAMSATAPGSGGPVERGKPARPPQHRVHHPRGMTTTGEAVEDVLRTRAERWLGRARRRDSTGRISRLAARQLAATVARQPARAHHGAFLGRAWRVLTNCAVLPQIGQIPPTATTTDQTGAPTAPGGTSPALARRSRRRASGRRAACRTGACDRRGRPASCERRAS